MLHVFAEENFAAGSTGRLNDHGVPERQTVQALQIDGSQDHFDAGNDYIELCEQLHATARERHVEMEFAHRVDEVFLQDLRGNHARFRETQIRDAVSLPPLPLRSVRAAC